MKKTFSLLILVLFICMSICPAIASEAEDEDIYYGDYVYTLENGQATITGCRGGCGPDWDDEESGLQDRPGRSDNDATYSNYFDGVWRTVVPDRLGECPVVAIGDYGLAECYAGDIILPEGLISIGAGAFVKCEYALAITVPQSVTFIGENAFDDECSATLRVTEGSYAARYAEENGLPYTYDPEYKVYESKNWLYTLTDGLATICGYEAFDDYDAYDDDDNADSAGNTIDIEIPAQLDGHLITAIKFRGYPYSFSGYDPLESETIYGSMTIPDSVTEIVSNPFCGIFFSSINASPNNSVYEAIDGVLFDKRQKMLIAYPGARTGAYVIPQETRGIGDGAFMWCERLTGVTIPSSVTSIGDNAFNGCTGLTSVTIPDSVTNIGDSAFFGCTDLTGVSIPSSVTSIGDEAFYWCASLTSVTIPDGVTSIGDEAFDWCGRLTSVTIPASVTEIVGNPFKRCGSIRLSVSSNNSMYETVDGVLFDKQQKMLISYPSAQTGTYTIPEGVAGIGEYAFDGCGGITYVTIPDSVTSIGDGAFFWCERLTGVSIPSGVTSIGDAAFYGCDSLTYVTIPGSVTSIGDEAFASCDGITYVTIPSSVTSIGKAAFERYGKPVTLSVTEGSFAEQYAQENDIPYVLVTE